MTPETQVVISTNPKPFVFVLMPFRSEYGDLYELGIRSACNDVGAYCERVDEQLFEGNILQRVYNQIAKADIIVSLLTGSNPNVYYETGYAHALNKRVILLVNAASEIPFDLHQFPHIVYEGSITRLKSDLRVRLRWYIENPSGAPPIADIAIEYSVEGEPLKDAPIIPVAARVEVLQSDDYWGNAELDETIRTGVSFGLTISIHNASNKTIHSPEFSIALVVPRGIAPLARSGAVLSASKLPDERWLFNLRSPHMSGKLFIDSWQSVVVLIAKRAVGRESQFALRCFTEFGPKDYPFTVQFR